MYIYICVYIYIHIYIYTCICVRRYTLDISVLLMKQILVLLIVRSACCCLSICHVLYYVLYICVSRMRNGDEANRLPSCTAVFLVEIPET